MRLAQRFRSCCGFDSRCGLKSKIEVDPGQATKCDLGPYSKLVLHHDAMSSFRKRNVVISKKGEDLPSSPVRHVATIPGVRPSPVTGHATTSTGTESLDKLLGLGAGLALGTSLMIEEEGTTEFARSLLSCYAAEGVLQGHAVFVVGPEGSLSLPGLAEEREKSKRGANLESEKMKIAWRYERLGNFGDRERGGFCSCLFNAISFLRSCTFPHDLLTLS